MHPEGNEEHARAATDRDRRLEAVDIPEPEAPGPGEVTLRVKAVALNHIDVWGWRGMAFAKRKMPLTIGAEASGVVEAIGPGVPTSCRVSWSRSMARGPVVSASPAARSATISANMFRAFTASIWTALRRKRPISRPASSFRPRPASMRSVRHLPPFLRYRRAHAVRQCQAAAG